MPPLETLFNLKTSDEEAENNAGLCRLISTGTYNKSLKNKIDGCAVNDKYFALWMNTHPTWWRVHRVHRREAARVGMKFGVRVVIGQLAQMSDKLEQVAAKMKRALQPEAALRKRPPVRLQRHH